MNDRDQKLKSLVEIATKITNGAYGNRKPYFGGKMKELLEQAEASQANMTKAVEEANRYVDQCDRPLLDYSTNM